MTEQFDKPLDEWINEEVKVPVFEAITDKRGNFKGVKETVEIRTQKTKYTRAVDSKFSCKDGPNGDHEWDMVDRHKYTAKCKHCTKHRFLRPVYETIRNGKIVDRDSGQVID